MKITIRCLSIVAAVTLLALPGFANGVDSLAKNVVQEPCSADSKIAIYGEFYKELHGDQAKAYEAAKKYVACPTDDKDAAEVARITYLKGFITKFEKQDRFRQMDKLLKVDKKYAEGFAIGKDILNDQPDNLKVILDVTNAGYSANSAALDGDTVAYAKKSIQMIESGKAPEKWEPFESKDDALGWMNYIIATRVNKTSPSDAIPYFIKSASYDGFIKKLPLTYNALGEAYEKGPYAKLSADYKAAYGGKDETPESKLALENINQVVDRIIDAYARAVALAGSDPKYATKKAEAMEALTDMYKFRNKSDSGLNELIAGILSKPLPPVPTPITTLPTTPATPASGPGSSATGASPTGNSSTTSSPGKAAAAATPSKSPGPTKPKMAHPR